MHRMTALVLAAAVAATLLPIALAKAQGDDANAPPADGVTLSDEEWGLEFRMPPGFTELPRKDVERHETAWLDMYREQAQGKGASLRGKMRIFVDSRGTQLILNLMSPPAQVESATAFLNAQHLDAKRRRLPIKDVGVPTEFKARGDLVGYLIGIDFGDAPGAPLATRKYVAWTRVEEVSLQVVLKGNPAACEALKGELDTSLASIALKRSEGGAVVPAAASTGSNAPARDTRSTSKTTVVFTIAVAVALLGALVLMLRKKPAAA